MRLLIHEIDSARSDLAQIKKVLGRIGRPITMGEIVTYELMTDEITKIRESIDYLQFVLGPEETGRG